MAFEDKLREGMASGGKERTYIDKVLAKDDVNALRELIKKPKLTREELLEILYLLSGSESKLLNYSEWDRYIILKFFVWIREFTKIAEILFDYEESLASQKEQLTPRTKKLFDNNSALIQHNAKFLIDLYLNIARTSMSVGAAAFTELLKNKYEVVYPQTPTSTPVEHKGGLFKWKSGD